MLPLIFEMKILKYTFTVPQIHVEDGELIEGKTKEETYYFTLLHKGIGLYEEMAGEPLISSLIDVQDVEGETAIARKVMDSNFLLNLAAASYTKIDGERFHNNRATCEEFKKFPVVNQITDPAFVTQLLQMATECVVGEIKQNPKSANPKK